MRPFGYMLLRIKKLHKPWTNGAPVLQPAVEQHQLWKAMNSSTTLARRRNTTCPGRSAPASRTSGPPGPCRCACPRSCRAAITSIGEGIPKPKRTANTPIQRPLLVALQPGQRSAGRRTWNRRSQTDI